MRDGDNSPFWQVIPLHECQKLMTHETQSCPHEGGIIKKACLKGIQAALCKDGNCSFPTLNEAAAAIFAKGSQSPFLYAMAGRPDGDLSSGD